MNRPFGVRARRGLPRGLAIAASSKAVMVVALLMAAGMAGLSMPASAVPSTMGTKPAAAKLDSLSFEPAIQLLKSTTGKRLQIRLGAGVTVQDGKSYTNADVTVSRNDVPEMHSWSFRLTDGSLRFNPTTGKGSVKSGSQLDPFAKIALTLTASGKPRTVTCGTFKAVTQPVSVTGSFSFDTRSTGKNRWGDVATTRDHGLSGKSDIVYDTGTFQSCTGGGFTLPCTADVSWNVFKQQGANPIDLVALSGTIQKVGAKTSSKLFASRNVAISRPKDTVRVDSTTVTDKKMVLTISASDKATMKVGAAGPLTGSAMLTSPQPGVVSTDSCGTSGQTETNTNWNVTYTNGKSPLTVHEQIEGSYRLPNLAFNDSGEDAIDKNTVS
jgi:hypothetical protein